MKDYLLNILDLIKQLPITLKDIAFLCAGVAGAIIAGFKKKLNRIQFIQSIFTGVFVSWILGTFLSSYLDLSNEVVYAFCALSGHFSDEILKQTSIIVKSLARYANSFIEKWLK
ncbi:MULTISPECIES: hypothetical protein [Empedobacter]|uniref:Holin n=1 Tax=Empedobacter falsenii TaxID=343874 RepID=A0A7H9DS46_9FLAO|nr:MULTISPECIES: hypothetical protein [Empedobacter]MDH2208324.1 hypothetical protein [Empedobacter sp. GD03644]QLL58003.1 hypothetical protein FH779_07890 [Empedobacter falsenii]